MEKESKGKDMESPAMYSGLSSSSSSSIGKNSDVSGKSSEESGDTEEVQSGYKSSLDAMEALVEVLPIRRGISRFYNGKSKSFTSLADASSSSNMKNLVKPENAYTRKRKNLLACNLILNKNRSSPLRHNYSDISKRSFTTIALAVATSSSKSDATDDSSSSNPDLISRSPKSSTCLLSQLGKSHTQQNFSAWRSFSLADLQHASFSPDHSSIEDDTQLT